MASGGDAPKQGVKNEGAWIDVRKAPAFTIRPCAYPRPRPNEIVIKNAAVGINAIDFMLQDEAVLEYLTYPNIFGCDVAGEVVEVGSQVTEFSIGQRVAGHCYGLDSNDTRQAGFQLYTALLPDITCSLPPQITYEQGVVFPCALSTAAAGLYQQNDLCLQLPNHTPKPTQGTILVWGGASCVGSCAIQLGRASGYDVFTTASPRNHAACISLGAKRVFDYNSADVETEIVSALSEVEFVGVFDAISAEGTLTRCAEIVRRALVSRSVKIIATNPVPDSDGHEGIQMRAVLAGDIVDSTVAKSIWKDYLPFALENNMFKLFPEPLVVGHGLEAIQSGVDRARRGLSAQKAVVTL